MKDEMVLIEKLFNIKLQVYKLKFALNKTCYKIGKHLTFIVFRVALCTLFPLRLVPTRKEQS